MLSDEERRAALDLERKLGTLKHAEELSLGSLRIIMGTQNFLRSISRKKEGTKQ